MPEESEYQFVDTNIFIYAYDVSSAEKHRRARELIAELWDLELGCLSIQVLQEFYVNLTMKIPNPLAPQKTAQIIADLGKWRLHQPDLTDIIEAIQIQQQNKLSFWDAMIICSAKNMGCKTIWTEDLNTDQSYAGIKAINPFL
jgi:predicted nucleic acid-binding protein